jgi:electron transfer flavoprotein alpha subunit
MLGNFLTNEIMGFNIARTMSLGFVVTINKDSETPTFGAADYGLLATSSQYVLNKFPKYNVN